MLGLLEKEGSDLEQVLFILREDDACPLVVSEHDLTALLP